jgi:hypothetical protein
MYQINTFRKKNHIFPQLSFGQMYKLHGYGQYEMKGNLINVWTNINQTQLILLYLPYNEVTIGVFLKWRRQYKSHYMSKNVHPNLIMLTLKNLNFNTIIYTFNCYHTPSMD